MKRVAKRTALLLHINVHLFYSGTYIHLFFYIEWINTSSFDVYSRHIEDTYLDGRYDLAIVVYITFELLFLRTVTVYIITGDDIKINERISSNCLS